MGSTMLPLFYVELATPAALLVPDLTLMTVILAIMGILGMVQDASNVHQDVTNVTLARQNVLSVIPIIIYIGMGPAKPLVIFH